MAGSMSLVDLVADFKRSLHDSGALFDAANDADFARFLTLALPDMQAKRPVTKLGSVTLVADVPRVALGVLNVGFSAFKTYLWGDARVFRPWEPAWPGTLPRVGATFADGQWWLVFTPAPTAKQISAHGSQFDFWYYAEHAIGTLPADTTINRQDRGLLMLRAQAEAMRELAIRNAAKPVQLRDGLSGAPRNSTPAALHQELMRQFEAAR